MSYLRNKIREKIITPLRIKHISGPEQPDLDREDVFVLCLSRDEDELFHGFLDHYRNMGVRQFVFVDNGSVDKTREIISNQSDCSLFSTKLHFGKYRVYIKRYMIEKFASDH